MCLSQATSSLLLAWLRQLMPYRPRPLFFWRMTCMPPHELWKLGGLLEAVRMLVEGQFTSMQDAVFSSLDVFSLMWASAEPVKTGKFAVTLRADIFSHRRITCTRKRATCARLTPGSLQSIQCSFSRQRTAGSNARGSSSFKPSGQSACGAALHLTTMSVLA